MHDMVVHDVGMHDMGFHDVAMHYVAVHDMGVPGMGVPGVDVHKMGTFFCSKKPIFDANFGDKMPIFPIICCLIYFLHIERWSLLENKKRPCRLILVFSEN